ncbi:hypothetical protein CH341_25310 [Rhodoplanes roseus]|uniref:Uncharacterized protein n=1 Tax=Rhodoplanes roseus TaxID=29409 RepID=A0A327KNW9_9BRAD|nr:hypothetical protein CH341_25310 [Rhodoplanes roseus]
MIVPAVLGAWPALVITPAAAQDVRGIEACGQESKLDRRTGCLQSNVEYLQQLVAKNNAAVNQRFAAAAAEIAALKASVAALQATVDKLAAAKPGDAKPADQKPSETKPAAPR